MFSGFYVGRMYETNYQEMSSISGCCSVNYFVFHFLYDSRFLFFQGMGLLPPDMLHSLQKESSSSKEGKEVDNQSDGRYLCHMMWCCDLIW